MLRLSTVGCWALSPAAARGARALKHQDLGLNIPLKYCISVCTQRSVSKHCTKWKLKSPSLAAIYQQISIYIISVTQIYTNCESGVLHFLKAFMNLNLQSALWVWFSSRPLPPAASPHKEKTSHAQPETKRGVYGQKHCINVCQAEYTLRDKQAHS